MILYVHSDALSLSTPCACSHTGGHYFLNDRSPDPTNPPRTRPRLNGPVHTVSKIMSNVMGSAAEAEIGATYINGQKSVPIRTLLHELDHPQPATPMQVNNSTAAGFTNDTIKQKRSKAINMNLYWIRERYHKKHHLPAHHRLMRSTYLHPTEQLTNTVIPLLLQEYVNPPVRASPIRHLAVKPPICASPVRRLASHKRLAKPTSIS